MTGPGPWWPLYPLGFLCCSVLQQWRSSGSHLCNPTLLWPWPGEGKRAGMWKTQPHLSLKAGGGWRGLFIPHPAHASKGCLGDTWARESPGLCHCFSKCHLQVLEALMALKCIFQIFSELITPLLLQWGSVPTQAHITHRGEQNGHPRVAQGPERAELCSPPQEQEQTSQLTQLPESHHNFSFQTFTPQPTCGGMKMDVTLSQIRASEEGAGQSGE